MGVDIVSLQVRTIQEAPISWVCVAIPISVPGWLSKVSCQGAVWQQSPLQLECLQSCLLVLLLQPFQGCAFRSLLVSSFLVDLDFLLSLVSISQILIVL